MTGINEAKRRKAQNGFDFYMTLEYFKYDLAIGDRLRIRVFNDGTICSGYYICGTKPTDTRHTWAEIIKKYPHVVQIRYDNKTTTTDYTNLYFAIDKRR